MQFPVAGFKGRGHGVDLDPELIQFVHRQRLDGGLEFAPGYAGNPVQQACDGSDDAALDKQDNQGE